MLSEKVIIKNPTGLHLRRQDFFAKLQCSLNVRF